MKCPNDDCDGELEARSRIFLDIERAEVNEDGDVVLHDIQFSRMNDHLDGHPCNFEEFELTCSEGHKFVDRLGDELRMRIGLQPIGDAPRTLIFRNGL